MLIAVQFEFVVIVLLIYNFPFLFIYYYYYYLFIFLIAQSLYSVISGLEYPLKCVDCSLLRCLEYVKVCVCVSNDFHRFY